MDQPATLDLLERFAKKFDMSDVQVARGLGVSTDTLRGWLHKRHLPSAMAEAVIIRFLKERLGNRNWSVEAEEGVRIAQEARAFAGVRSVRKSLSFDERLAKEKTRLDAQKKEMKNLEEEAEKAAEEEE